MPSLTLIAGPNGVGKSTLAKQIAPDWINPDTSPGVSNVARGRWVIARTHRLIEDVRSFALETTLSGRWTYALATRAKAAGYEVHLHFVALASAELASQRILARVEIGGHDVAQKDQERRFPRAFENAIAISALADSLVLYDNSGAAKDRKEHRIVGRRMKGRRLSLVRDAPPWARLFLKKSS